MKLIVLATSLTEGYARFIEKAIVGQYSRLNLENIQLRNKYSQYSDLILMDEPNVEPLPKTGICSICEVNTENPSSLCDKCRLEINTYFVKTK